MKRKGAHMSGRKAIGSVSKKAKTLHTSDVGKIIRKATKALHEPKYHDNFGTHGVGTGIVALELMNATTQGVTGDSRIGRDFINEYLELNATVTTAAGTSDFYRLMVIWDKESLGAAWTAAQVFQNAAATNPVVSLYNADNLHRFQILYDTGPLPLAAASSLTPASITIKKKVHINKKTHCANTSVGTIADITSGSLWVLETSANGNPTSVFDFRLKYRDL